jgi:hypothetical protein
MQLYGFSENLSIKFEFHYNLTGISGTLHADVCILIIITRLILFRMRNVSDKSFRGNLNTFRVK